MTNEKMTMRVFLENVIGGNLTDEVKEFAQDRLEKLDERNANRKVSKAELEKQAKDAQLRMVILSLMEAGRPYKAGDLVEAVNGAVESEKIISVNKIGSQLKKLAEGGELTVDKSSGACVYTR